MTDTQGNLPPAGWYPDPYGAPYERWWDGAQWTDHTNVPAAPEPVAPAAPVAPSYPVTSEPAYQAPIQTAEPAYQAPIQSAEPAYQEPVYQAPLQTAEPAYQAPTYQTPGASFDDIFATGSAPASTPTQQPAFAQPQTAVPAQPYVPPQAYEQPQVYSQPQAYSQPQVPAQVPVPAQTPVQPQEWGQTQQPAYDPYAAQQASRQTDPAAEFSQLITGGGGASDSADPFDSWSNQDYEEPPRNTPATVGLTFGILSFIIPGVAGLVGLITSVIGLTRASRFKREEGVALGRGKAIAGLVLSVVGSAASAAAVVFLLPGFLNPADTTTDDAASAVVAPAPKTTNNFFDLQPGATGTIVFAGTTDPSIEFTITGVTVNPECTEDPALVLSPENGQFVAVTMEFTTSADYATAMDSGGLLSVSTANFIGLLPDGTTVTNTTAGLSCIPEAEQLPTEIAAGATTSGTVILDVTAETTSFSFAPSGVTGLDTATTRWETPIPR